MRLASILALASQHARAWLSRGPRPGSAGHLRSRWATLGTGLAAAAVVSSALPVLTERSAATVAAALGEACAGRVEPVDFIWAPSRGAFADAVWGRDVAFLARTDRGAAAPRDVYRARVAVAPGGYPLRVEAVERETNTPLADEHDLVARGHVYAWATRGDGGEQGATVSIPEDPRSPTAPSSFFEKRRRVDVVLAKPADSISIEVRDEGLVIALRRGEDESRALVEPHAQQVRTSGAALELDVVRAAAPVKSWSLWQKDVVPPPPGSPPAAVDAPVDPELFPPRLSWAAISVSPPLVASPVPASAAVVRAVVESSGGRVVVTGFDMRQLVLRVVPGPAGPPAVAGLPGTGRMAADDEARLVATTLLAPTRGARPGALQGGRVIAPLAVDAPRIAADERGTLSLAHEEGFAPLGAIQTAAPGEDEPVAGWCKSSTGAVFVAVASPPTRSLIDQALAPLACVASAWVSGAVDAEPKLGPSSGGTSYAAFVRGESFPEGRKETWTPSPGRQPSPAFLPAVLQRDEVVSGETVHVTAFVADRLSWAIRVGSRERSHRAGGTFPAVLEEALRARAVAAVDLGVAQRKRPNGLTVNGSTGHAYASRGAVLFATPTGLSLLPSSEVREDPQGDAVELPLTALGGTPTPVALKRGLLQDRADICVLPDGTALVALARFESHQATAEALCRLGCSEVAGLDRGLDVVAGLSRAGEDPLPPTHPVTRLIASAPGSSLTP